MLYVLLVAVIIAVIIIGVYTYLHATRHPTQGPAGQPGAAGPRGPTGASSLVAAWDPQHFYASEDRCGYTGAVWQSTGDANQGNPPDTSPTWWQPAS